MALARRDDYLESLIEERYEIIRGRVYMMDSPVINHQRIVGVLFRSISNFLVGKTCEAIIAPFDVRLLDPGEDPDSPRPPRNIVQPDIIVVCDKKKITLKRCLGPPDLVIEVLSPSTTSKDFVAKRDLYERAGVLEYWIVDPVNRVINVMRYENAEAPQNESAVQSWVAFTLPEEAELTTPILEGLTIQIKEVFADMLPED